MINLTKFISTSLLLCLLINKIYSDSEPIVNVPAHNGNCQEDFASKCHLQCENGNYLIDEKGCSICACASNEGQKSISCPKMKCRSNCGDGGYQLDQNGCQTCTCVKKESAQCSKVMCRMFCQNGFKRDENGCEYCACNESPQACPTVDCQQPCINGYRKDYSGCQTCECNEQQEKLDDKCIPVECDFKCKYGFQKDSSDCKICACNSCPLRRCKMYCMYGFRKNEDGCEICECDWTPVSEKIQCSERIPCPDTRVCNSKLKLCEKVDPDNVNWFLYDFEVKSDIFTDRQFVQIFKNGLTNNIAKRYNLQTTQIHVSSVEQHGLASFQIMPMFGENMEEFQNKIDKIDADLNSHEFRSVLPAVVHVIDENDGTTSPRSHFSKFCGKIKTFIRTSIRSITWILIFLLLGTGLIFLIIRINVCCRRFQNSKRSDSKSPIYESGYHQAPTDDDQFHGAHVATEPNDGKLSKEKQVYV